MRELALSYGVYPSYQEKKKSMDEFIHIALKNLSISHNMESDDIVVVLAGNFSAGRGFSFIEVGSVQYLKDRVSIKD
jgi:pyruvate kinase